MFFKRDDVTYVEGDRIQPCNLWKADVERYAERVAETTGFVSGGDLGKLVTALGGTIHYRDLDELLAFNGSVFVHGAGDFDVILPTYTSPLRDRFTIGHELGHYFLHSRQGDISIVAYRQGSSRIEWEANWFAAALLMPEAEFKRAWDDLPNLPAVAAHFGVSQEAARVRKDRVCG